MVVLYHGAAAVTNEGIFSIPNGQKVWCQHVPVTCADKDRSSFVDAGEDHTDLYSAIRRYIRPNSVTVVHSGQVSRLQEAAGDPKRPTQPGPPRKKKAKGKKNATKKAPPPPPPPAPEEDTDEAYGYEDAE